MKSDIVEVTKEGEYVTMEVGVLEATIPQEVANEFGLMLEELIPQFDVSLEIEEQMYKMAYELQSID